MILRKRYENQVQIYMNLRIRIQEYKITFQSDRTVCARGAKKYQKLPEVSNGQPGVLRSHLASDRYILMDRLSNVV